MTDLTWTNSTRRLSELVPWEDNPRQIGEADAKRLAESLDQFGQIHAIAIGPDNAILDGHQRSNVWAACDRYGPEYEVDVRVSSRPLTQAEREKLVIQLHSGATGSWDWEKLSSWDAPVLQGWGLDEGQLREWNDNAANLSVMLEAETFADAMGALPDCDKPTFQQMTFTLHDDQAETVREALKTSRGLGAFVDTGNENGNGNALARICELFAGDHGQG